MSKIQNIKGRYVIWHNEMDGKYLTTEDQTQAYQSGYDSGYTYGVATSFDSGYTSGFTVGYESGFTDGEESVPLESTGITENGTYTKDEGGWNNVTVNVPLESTGFTENGEYVKENGGWSAVTVDVSTYVPLTTTGFTENGSYTNVEGGWSGVTVDVPLETTGITKNGTYTKADGGWNRVTVNVPLTSTGFTENGTYETSNGGWNRVTVNVNNIETNNSYSLQPYHMKQVCQIYKYYPDEESSEYVVRSRIVNQILEGYYYINNCFAFYVSVHSGDTLYFTTGLYDGGPDGDSDWMFWGEGTGHYEHLGDNHTYIHTYTRDFTGWIGAYAPYGTDWGGNGYLTDLGNIPQYATTMAIMYKYHNTEQGAVILPNKTFRWGDVSIGTGKIS